MLIVEDPCHKPKIRRRNDHRSHSGSSYPVASANAIAIAMEGGVVVATRTETSAAVEETQTPCHALVFEKAKLDHNLLTADYYDHVHMRILDASMLAIPSNNRNDGVSQSQNEDQHEDNDNNNVNTHNNVKKWYWSIWAKLPGPPSPACCIAPITLQIRQGELAVRPIQLPTIRNCQHCQQTDTPRTSTSRRIRRRIQIRIR